MILILTLQLPTIKLVKLTVAQSLLIDGHAGTKSLSLPRLR